MIKALVAPLLVVSAFIAGCAGKQCYDCPERFGGRTTAGYSVLVDIHDCDFDTMVVSNYDGVFINRVTYDIYCPEKDLYKHCLYDESNLKEYKYYTKCQEYRPE